MHVTWILQTASIAAALILPRLLMLQDDVIGASSELSLSCISLSGELILTT